MPGFSDYLEPLLLNLVLGAVAFSPPGTVYVSLHTADPTDAGSGTEVSGNGYARAAVTNNTTNWPNSTQSGGTTTKQNGTSIAFPTVTGAGWSIVSHFAVWDAVSGGNMLLSGSLNSNLTVSAGAGPSFPAGSLSGTLS